MDSEEDILFDGDGGQTISRLEGRGGLHSRRQRVSTWEAQASFHCDGRATQVKRVGTRPANTGLSERSVYMT